MTDAVPKAPRRESPLAKMKREWAERHAKWLAEQPKPEPAPEPPHGDSP